jgi:hypothetical protein
MLPMSPTHTEDDLEILAHNIRVAAAAISDGQTGPIDGLRAAAAPDLQKFDAVPGE